MRPRHRCSNSFPSPPPPVRPDFQEMTVLGAAIAAGMAAGVWRDTSHLPTPHTTPFTPSIPAEGRSPHVGHVPHKLSLPLSPAECDMRYGRWKEAVRRSMHWEGSTPGLEGRRQKSEPLGE